MYLLLHLLDLLDLQSPPTVLSANLLFAQSNAGTPPPKHTTQYT